MRTRWVFVACVVLAALSGSALILLVPSLFDRSDPRVGVMVGLAALCMVAIMVGRYVRRSALDQGR